jgi:hypothetical protein
MQDSVEINRDSDDGLQRRTWRFIRLDDQLVVDGYAELARENKRQKFKQTQFYERLRRRESTLKVDTVPLSDDIKSEAIDVFLTSLRTSLSVCLTMQN